MHSVGIDQPCQLVRARSQAPFTSVVRPAAHCANRQLRPVYRSEARAFITSACPAKFRTAQRRLQTHVLRCAASKAAETLQSDFGKLQAQVDRLSSLLQTLEGLNSWHDKVHTCFAVGKHRCRLLSHVS